MRRPVKAWHAPQYGPVDRPGLWYSHSLCDIELEFLLVMIQEILLYSTILYDDDVQIGLLRPEFPLLISLFDRYSY